MRILSKAFLIHRDAYLREHCPWLYRPGVPFTAEQEAKIHELIQANQIVEAQRIILTELEQQQLESNNQS